MEIKGWNVDRTVARRAPKLNPLPIILAAVPFMASLLMPVPNWFTGLLGAIFGAAVSVSVMTHLRGRYDLQCKLDQALDTLMHASSLARQGAKTGSQIQALGFTFLKVEGDRYEFLGRE